MFSFKVQFCFFAIFLFLIQVPVFAQTSNDIGGQVVNAYSHSPIRNTKIRFESPDKKIFETVTDDKGIFELKSLLPGRYTISVESNNFQGVSLTEYLVGRINLPLTIELIPRSSELPELVISSQKSGIYVNPLNNTSVVTREETEKFAAGFFDPARLFINQPGVYTRNDGANHLVIRGNNPLFTAWNINGTEIVNPNHLSNSGITSDRSSTSGGGVNMISASVLDNTYLSKGPYNATKGNALAGVIDLSLRDGSAEQLKTEAQISLLGLELGIEGPIAKNGSSFITRYRYSTVGLLSKLGVKFGDEDISYQDFMFHYSLPTSKSKLSLFMFTGNHMDDYAGQKDSILRTEPKQFNNIVYKGNQSIFGLTYETKLSATNRWLTDLIYSKFSNSRYESLVSNPFVMHKDLSHQSKFSTHTRYVSISKNNTVWTTGIEAVFNKDGYQLQIADVVNDMQVDRKHTTLQPYTNILWHHGRWATQVGLRGMIVATQGQFVTEGSLDPRAQTSYTLNAKNSILFSIGKYSQVPTLYSYLDKDHFLGKSYQGQVSHLYDHNHVQWTTSLFYQYHYQIPAMGAFTLINESPTSGNHYTSDKKNTGIVYGIETGINYRLSHWHMLHNLTILKSTYDNYLKNGLTSQFDQGHMFHTNIGREWNTSTEVKRKIVGLNLAFHIAGALKDSPLPILTGYDYAKLYSIRRPEIYRVDVRIYRRKFYPHMNTLLALDVQNLTGQQNFAYSYYFKNATQFQYQLGLLPNLSYTIEF